MIARVALTAGGLLVAASTFLAPDLGGASLVAATVPAGIGLAWASAAVDDAALGRRHGDAFAFVGLVAFGILVLAIHAGAAATRGPAA